MKTCPKCEVEKPVTGFSRCKSRKGGLAGHCKVCVSAYHAAAYAADPSKQQVRAAAYYVANKEKINARHAAYRAANPEKEAVRHAVYQGANPEKCNAKSAAWVKANPERAAATYARYQKAHPDRCTAAVARRNAAKLQATPIWADSRAIGLWYAGAKTMTQLAGSPYHVDHIVPLRSKLVCGLHVEHNLQLLPPAENCSKSNRHWPDMPI